MPYLSPAQAGLASPGSCRRSHGSRRGPHYSARPGGLALVVPTRGNTKTLRLTLIELTPRAMRCRPAVRKQTITANVSQPYWMGDSMTREAGLGVREC